MDNVTVEKDQKLRHNKNQKHAYFVTYTCSRVHIISATVRQGYIT